MEDDLDLLTGLQDLLFNTERYDIVAREDGFSAIEVLKKNPRVDLILSDYMMVGKGSDLARAAVEFGIPVIIITGNYEEAVQALKSYSLKVPVIKKPFDPPKLIELLDHYLFGKPLGGSPIISAWWDDLK